MEQEDDASGFLGATLERDLKTGLLKIKHTGLIQRVIEAVVLYDGMKRGTFKPSEANPLVKYENGELVSGMFSHSSDVGILLHMSGHTRPDVPLK